MVIYVFYITVVQNACPTTARPTFSLPSCQGSACGLTNRIQTTCLAEKGLIFTIKNLLVHLLSLSWYVQSNFGGNRTNRFLSSAAYKHTAIRSDRQVVKTNYREPQNRCFHKALNLILFQSLYLSLL